MSYATIKQGLIQEFNQNNFMENKYNIYKFKFNYYGGAKNIDVRYPGKRAKKGVYDYRVEFDEAALSHGDIARDLYNKSMQDPNLRDELEDFIVDLAFNGDDVDLNNYTNLVNYNWNGGLSIEDLYNLLPVLTLQDDINFPIANRFLGRRMCFYRYIEGIRCMENNVPINRVIYLANQRGVRNDRQQGYKYRGIENIQ
ncbi:hypothetical protein [Paraclostridium bifermentans]|uniref:hypothetical protein n=1 Tax=Paraclostridium bifermentans TaxID=1490 RepID=UPI0018A9FC83|nr:hypothetical protein [Paraclostridium bifermentans]